MENYDDETEYLRQCMWFVPPYKPKVCEEEEIDDDDEEEDDDEDNDDNADIRLPKSDPKQKMKYLPANGNSTCRSYNRCYNKVLR